MIKEQKECRVGLMCFSDEVMAELGITLEVPNSGIVADTSIFATVKERLLLPEHYRITDIFLYPVLNARRPRVWGIYVESPQLALLTKDVWPTAVRPMYVREASGHVRLKGIRIERDEW